MGSVPKPRFRSAATPIATTRSASLGAYAEAVARERPGALAPVVALASGALLFVVLAGPVAELTRATAAQLAEPAGFVDAVLGPRSGERLR